MQYIRVAVFPWAMVSNCLPSPSLAHCPLSPSVDFEGVPGRGDNIIGSYKGQRLTPVIYRVDWWGHRQHVPYPNWNRSPIILWLISPFKLWKTGARSRIRRRRLLFSIVNNGRVVGWRWPFNGAQTGPSSSPLICHQPRVVIVNSKPVERLCGRNPFDESNVYTNAHWTRSFLVSSDK